MNKRKLRMGMVGGGPAAFIGDVHRMAAALDGQIELVCGAFSSDPKKSLEKGLELFLPRERIYASFQEMIVTEAKLPEAIRMDFVAIVTPNHLHFEPAKLAIQHGFDVVCDKPLCHNLNEAEELVNLVESSDRIFCLTHNYTGYPMTRQARAMVKNGELGAIRKVVVEYPQGWLSTLIEAEGQKQADWRTNPAKAGKAGSMGDIGTHAENLIVYITGLEIEELAADLSIFVTGRKLDDDGSVLLRFKGGAKGLLFASQICVGEENNLKIRVYGEKASLQWQQQEPNSLCILLPDKPAETLRTGHGYLYAEAKSASRLPAGHPEGYIEAFANMYRDFSFACQQRNSGLEFIPDFPGVREGLQGMKFIEAVVKSSSMNASWVKP